MCDVKNSSVKSKSGMLSALGYRNFRSVWAGQFVSQVGSATHAIAISFYLKEATDSGASVGLVLFLSGVMAIICLPFAGAFADRYNRKKIVLVCGCICAASTMLMAFVFNQKTGGISGVVYLASACTIIISVCTAFFRPAFGAMLPDLVPRDIFAPANAFYKSGARVGDLCGTTWGGALYRALGPDMLCLVNSLSYFFSVILLLRVGPNSLFKTENKTPGINAPDIKRNTFKNDAIGGLRIIAEAPGGVQFMSMPLIINFCAAPIFVLMPFHASGALNGGVALFGLLMASFSIGILTGCLLSTKIPIRSERDSCYFVVAALVVMCSSFIVVAQAATPAVAIGALIVAGIANGYWNIFFETSLQGAIPRAKLGRFFSSFGLLSGGLTPLSSLIGGVSLDAINKDTALLFTLCSIAMVAYTLLMATNRKFVGFFVHLAVKNEKVNRVASL